MQTETKAHTEAYWRKRKFLKPSSLFHSCWLDPLTGSLSLSTARLVLLILSSSRGNQMLRSDENRRQEIIPLIREINFTILRSSIRLISKYFFSFFFPNIPQPPPHAVILPTNPAFSSIHVQLTQATEQVMPSNRIEPSNCWFRRIFLAVSMSSPSPTTPTNHIFTFLLSTFSSSSIFHTATDNIRSRIRLNIDVPRFNRVDGRTRRGFSEWSKLMTKTRIHEKIQICNAYGDNI